MLNASPSVNIARLIYLLVCEVAGVILAVSTQGNDYWEVPIWVGVLGGVAVAGFFILVESLIKGFTLRGFSTGTFGLLVGLFCAFLLTRVGFFNLITTILSRNFEERTGGIIPGPEVAEVITQAITSLIYASFGFLGAVLALRSNRDDFAFILPYVRFRQDGVTGRPVVLDSEAIMDGRVAGVVKSGFISGRLIVPRFILDEVQDLAESPTQAIRLRAKRSLDMLEELQSSKEIPIAIEEAAKMAPDETIQGRLLQTAQMIGARLLTSDQSLSRVAKLQGVEVLNLRDLEDALRPDVVVGEKVRIALVRGGKDEHQAVGYLSDGTMIVVNQAVDRIGTTVNARVISTLQTSNGVMVFSELDE